MIAICPHCGEHISNAIYHAWAGDYWEHCDDFECPKCGGALDVTVEMEPVVTLLPHKEVSDG